VKFTDGYWMMRPGVQAFYPAQVLDGETVSDSLVVHAPCYRFRDREDLLRGPALTVAFAAPLPDVIRVSVTHFAGQDRKPDFVLVEAESEAPVITEDDNALTFTSGALTARIAKGRAGAWTSRPRAGGSPAAAPRRWPRSTPPRAATSSASSWTWRSTPSSTASASASARW